MQALELHQGAAQPELWSCVQGGTKALELHQGGVKPRWQRLIPAPCTVFWRTVINTGGMHLLPLYCDASLLTVNVDAGRSHMHWSQRLVPWRTS